MSTSVIGRDSRGRGSISLYFRVAEAAFSFSASPVADIDQVREGEARGQLSIHGRESLVPTHPTSDSLAVVLQSPAHDIVDWSFPECLGLTYGTAFRPIHLDRTASAVRWRKPQSHSLATSR
jgi:hypothetical protein